jgi:hypothetical protein
VDYFTTFYTGVLGADVVKYLPVAEISQRTAVLSLMIAGDLYSTLNEVVNFADVLSSSAVRAWASPRGTSR